MVDKCSRSLIPETIHAALPEQFHALLPVDSSPNCPLFSGCYDTEATGGVGADGEKLGLGEDGAKLTEEVLAMAKQAGGLPAKAAALYTMIFGDNRKESEVGSF